MTDLATVQRPDNHLHRPATHHQQGDTVAITPTPAQRRELLTAIEHGGKVQPRVGASTSRLRAALLRNGWIQGGQITDAGRRAVDRPTCATAPAAPPQPSQRIVLCQYSADPHPIDDECVNVRDAGAVA